MSISVRRLATVLATTTLLAFSAGCVSEGRYDAAVADAQKTRSDARSAQLAAARREGDLRASLDGVQRELADLQKQLDDETALNKELGTRLEGMGTNVDKLVSERGDLANALALSKQRLEEVRRAQAAAEARAALFHDLARRLQKMIDAGDLRVTLRDGRMVLEMPSDILFDSGMVDIKPGGRTALAQVGAVLKLFPQRRFEISGHTDNVPIATSRYASNWELSCGRALEVVHFLVAQGLAPANLSAAGYGEFDPVAANDAEKGRHRNRRIEIVLQPTIDELVAVPPQP